MIQIELKNGLLFTTIKLNYRGGSKEINNVVIDTGAAETIITPDAVEEIGLIVEREDIVNSFYGVGGSLHSFFIKKVDQIYIGNRALSGIEIDFGLVDPKGSINGLLGLDLLTQIGAVIDIKHLELRME